MAVDAIRTGQDRVVQNALLRQQLIVLSRSVSRPRFLIRDNDGKYGAGFAAVAAGSGIEVLKIPPMSPNLNPICERFLGSVRRVERA